MYVDVDVYVYVVGYSCVIMCPRMIMKAEGPRREGGGVPSHDTPHLGVVWRASDSRLHTRVEATDKYRPGLRDTTFGL